jgi:hypothetical protein
MNITLTASTVTPPQATVGIKKRPNSVRYPHQLFPHQWGAIEKEQWVEEGEKPEWRTLQYKIQAADLDRIYASEDTLIGVRFGKLTKYLVVDIDIHSLCHPEVNRSEWDRLMLALEEVGLVDRIIVQSSDSGGLHIYFWFGEELRTFRVAQLLWSVCHAGGFELRGGNVETFPNAKRHTKIPSMYNGHRLPLQPGSGSILLDHYFEEIETLNPWEEFCFLVNSSEQDMELLKRKLAWGKKYHKKHARYSNGRVHGSAAEWLKSLTDGLNLGWTGKGQSNELIRTACVKAWVFGDGSRNDAEIVEQLVNTPGYQEFCGHQHEIVRRVKDWMDCVTKQYWPYCRPDMRPYASMRHEQPPAKKPSSTKLIDDVMDRLRQVVAAVSDQPLPKKIAEIVQMIKEKGKEMFGQGFGTNTLYKAKYALEWRILVEKAQTQTETAFSQSLEQPKNKKIPTSNPGRDSVFSEFVPMKVCSLLKISAIEFLLLVENGISSLTNFSTTRSQNQQVKAKCPIKTDKPISFTDVHTPPGAAPEAISRPNQSISTLDLSASPPAIVWASDCKNEAEVSLGHKLLVREIVQELVVEPESIDVGAAPVCDAPVVEAAAQFPIREMLEVNASMPSAMSFSSAWIRTFAPAKAVVGRSLGEKPPDPETYYREMLAERLRLFWAEIPATWAESARDWLVELGHLARGAPSGMHPS